MKINKFQFFEQFDQMDCGPTCLKMILKFHGIDYPIEQLRNLCDINKDGVSLLAISEAAEKLGFITVGHKINFEQLIENFNNPCILFWNQNHFVVLQKIKKNKITIADPAVGLIEYSFDEFKSKWLITDGKNKLNAGISLFLEPTKELSKLKLQSYKSSTNIFQLSLKFKKHLLFLILILLVSSIIQLILPFITQSIFDKGISNKDYSYLQLIFLAQFFLITGKLSSEVIRRWVLLQLSNKINMELVSSFLKKLLKLPLSFFNTKLVGDLLQRVEDYQRIERFLSSSSLSIMFSIINLIVFSSILIVYNTFIALIFFVVSIVYLVYITSFLKKRAAIDHSLFTQNTSNQNLLIQIIQGISDIKLSNAEVQQQLKWKEIQNKIFEIKRKGFRIIQAQEFGGLFINEIKNLLITIAASYFVINGDITVGVMLAIIFVIGQMNSPLYEFINFIREYQDAQISFKRTDEVNNLNEEDEGLQSSKYFVSSDIVIKNLKFKYEIYSNQFILNNISIIIPEGKVTAIVGSSGSGKTTLIKVLLKFFNRYEGDILIGNINLREIKSEILRRECGVVMQDGFIFSDTIENNISMFDADPDNERLANAAKIALMYDYIIKLPLGFKTIIGNNGIGLSQGQKQRILIARAVYKDPKVLIFDEATSSLDSSNEKLIVQNMEAFFHNRTVILIAHRLSTVKNADNIVVLENGEVVESGTHSYLVSKKGSYFTLVKNQLELKS